MKYGIDTCRDPIDPAALYMRCLFHEFFYGPFADEAALTEAINVLDRTVPWWDYDTFCIIRGKDPLPSDYVFGFPFVEDEMRERIEAQRIPHEQRPQPREG